LAGIVGADATTVEDTGLACGTRYTYRMRAYRSGDGQFSDYTDTDDSRTALCDIQAPTDLSATAISQTQIDLVWNDNSDDETAFYVERSPDSSDWTDIETSAANSESYSDSDLTPIVSEPIGMPTVQLPTPILMAPRRLPARQPTMLPRSRGRARATMSRTACTRKAAIRRRSSSTASSTATRTTTPPPTCGCRSSRIYEFQSALPAGADYIYRFEAQDVHGAGATPTSSRDAPDVVGSNAAPVLSWTGESGYVADGLQPESGDMFTVFAYRVKYSDADGDAPTYVRVQIKKGGTAISGSPFAMAYTGGEYAGGAIYTFDLSGRECRAAAECADESGRSGRLASARQPELAGQQRG